MYKYWYHDGCVVQHNHQSNCLTGHQSSIIQFLTILSIILYQSSSNFIIILITTSHSYCPNITFHLLKASLIWKISHYFTWLNITLLWSTETDLFIFLFLFDFCVLTVPKSLLCSTIFYVELLTTSDVVNWTTTLFSNQPC